MYPLLSNLYQIIKQMDRNSNLISQYTFLNRFQKLNILDSEETIALFIYTSHLPNNFMIHAIDSIYGYD